jgi:hypothetical protein
MGEIGLFFVLLQNSLLGNHATRFQTFSKTHFYLPVLRMQFKRAIYYLWLAEN